MPGNIRCAGGDFGSARAFDPDSVAEAVADKIYTEPDRYGLTGEPIGIDLGEMPVLLALRA